MQRAIEREREKEEITATQQYYGKRAYVQQIIIRILILQNVHSIYANTFRMSAIVTRISSIFFCHSKPFSLKTIC